jgi:septum formation inhibitor-activating ATPase MinD
VPDDYRVVLAAASGTPLVLFESKGAAEACLHIARRLCGRRTRLMKL